MMPWPQQPGGAPQVAKKRKKTGEDARGDRREERRVGGGEGGDSSRTGAATDQSGGGCRQHWAGGAEDSRRVDGRAASVYNGLSRPRRGVSRPGHRGSPVEPNHATSTTMPE